MEITDKKPLFAEDGQQLSDFFTISGQTNVIADGPLAPAFTKALDELYRREYDPLTGVALETQAMDEIEAKRHWLAAKVRSLQFANDGTDVGMVYGVKEAQAEQSDLINVVDTLCEMNDTQKANSAIVIEPASETGDGIERVENEYPVATALEQYAVSKGIKVYHSFNEFIRKHGV